MFACSPEVLCFCEFFLMFEFCIHFLPFQRTVCHCAAESITSGLSWASVAEHVGTRSEKQCRTKWLNYLNWKQQGGADWTREDDTILIEK